MKLRAEDVTRAIAVMKQTIPFFPQEVLGVQMVQRSIEDFVSTPEQLQWLTKVACNQMKQFSLPELRGIFCSKFAPADGMWSSADTPGFTPDEALAASEQAYHEREAKEYERKLELWKEESKLLGSGTPEPFEIPAAAVKALPEPKPEKSKIPGPPLPEAEAELKQQLAVARRRSPEEAAKLLADLERQLQPADRKWLH